MMRKKYAELEDQSHPNDEPEWSKDDLKDLRRLVRRFGRNAVCDAAIAVRLTETGGRPPRGDIPLYEAMHLASWVEEQVAEYKEQGLRAPLKRAINDAYDMIYGDDPDRPDPGKFARTLKRKYYPALRALRLEKEAAERRNAFFRKRKGAKK